MYKRERIIIDTRKYDVDEVFERYKRGLLIFYEKSAIKRTHKSKVTREVLEALSRGLPFPPVYVSELQTGELLVLDKSDRLRFLMEYLAYGFKTNSGSSFQIEEMRYLAEKSFVKDIFYSTIILHVIDYVNPRYMHMQVGAFIEGWSATQEQSIRSILYQRLGMQVLDELFSEMNYPPKLKLSMQYKLIYFIMVSFITFKNFDYLENQNADKFQLLEKTMYELQDKDYSFLKDLCELFEYIFIKQILNSNKWFLQASPENKTKYLCFMGAWIRIRNGYNLDEVFENKKIRNIIINCDMGYRSISRILEDFREGNL